MSRIRGRLTYANVVATLSLFLVLAGGTALASYVVTSNSQVGPNVISGHKPPRGDHANVAGGSLAAIDLASGAVTSGKIANGQVMAPDLAHPSFHSAGLNPLAQPDCPNSDKWMSWHPGAFGDVGYYRDLEGRVHLSGIATKCNNAPQTIITLPAGYRPSFDQEVPGLGDGSPAGIWVTAAGAVYPVLGGAASGDNYSLDGISFRCGPSGHHGCP
jgi:hypothetical protein